MRATPPEFPVCAIWRSELSPFALKLRAICDDAGTPYAWLPRDGNRFLDYRVLGMISRAERRRTAIPHPRLSDLDEYPCLERERLPARGREAMDLVVGLRDPG